MTKKIGIIIVFLSLCVSGVFAEINIKAEADKKSITTDEALTYKIIVTSTERQSPAPQIPPFKDFRILSQAQSSTMSFGKGSIKSIVVYVFILAPAKSGSIKIDPATIKIQDKIYSTDSLEIEVTQGKSMPKPQPQPPSQKPGSKPQERPTLPQGSQSQTEQPQVTL